MVIDAAMFSGEAEVMGGVGETPRVPTCLNSTAGVRLGPPPLPTLQQQSRGAEGRGREQTPHSGATVPLCKRAKWERTWGAVPNRMDPEPMVVPALLLLSKAPSSSAQAKRERVDALAMHEVVAPPRGNG